MHLEMFNSSLSIKLCTFSKSLTVLEKHLALSYAASAQRETLLFSLSVLLA